LLLPPFAFLASKEQAVALMKPAPDVALRVLPAYPWKQGGADPIGVEMNERRKEDRRSAVQEPVAWARPDDLVQDGYSHSFYVHQVPPAKGDFVPLYVAPVAPSDHVSVPRMPTLSMIRAADPNDDLDVTWGKMIAAAEKEQP